MKIVGIGSFMNAAGAQSALLRVMDNLRLRGHDTQTWYFYEEQPIFRGRPHVHSFFEKPSLSALDYARLPLLTLQRLRQEKPDAVVTFLPLACLVGQSAARLCGTRVRMASQRTPPSKHGAAMRLLDKLVGSTGFYTLNVCVSRSVLEEFASYPASYRSRLSVVHNGIAWQGSSCTRDEARARFGIAPETVVAVATGRMKHQKNFSFMLDVLAQTPAIHLLIAGDGPLRPALEEQARRLDITKRVTFLGALAPSGVADLLRAADVFVQTSSFEGQSNSILEAMAEGLPIVASDIPMQRESLERDDGVVCAELLPLGDPVPWAKALSRLATDRSERLRLGGMALAHVKARFTLDAMIDGFEALLTGASKRTI
jgi:glycosyltransferase involved in cell wall biosynthesis